MSTWQGDAQGPIVVHAPSGREVERRYILDLVLTEWLGLTYRLEHRDGPRVALSMDGDDTGREVSMPDILFATSDEDWLTPRSMPKRPLSRSTDLAPPTPGTTRASQAPTSLPLVFGENDASGRAIRPDASGLVLAVDVFGSAFYMLTRYEELVVQTRDGHGRYPVTESLAYREGFLERPVVDEYVDLLWSAMRALWPALERPVSTFTLRLTHDVDQPWAATGQPLAAIGRSMVADVVRRRDLRLAAQRVTARLDMRAGRVDRDPYNTHEFLMDVSERHGVTSTFYFLAGNEPGDRDFRYRITDSHFGELLRRIHDRGHEIGLHASYVSPRSAGRIQHEFEGLKAACAAVGVEQASWGVRQHYLRFEAPETWRHQDAAGLAHDSTVGFAEHIGFRAGTCREYPVFDLQESRRLSIRERPLVVMDGTLYEYMRLSAEEAEDRVRSVVDVCRRHAGMAVLLYHNNSIPVFGLTSRYDGLVRSLTAP